MAKEIVFKLRRLRQTDVSTVGEYLTPGGKHIAYSIEDIFRKNKVYEKTRIPAGKYRLELQTYGKHHERYLKQFGSSFHKGTVHVMDVPNFTGILIHQGLDESWTAGCLLVGYSWEKTAAGKIHLIDTVAGYKKLYPQLRDAILSGTPTYIQITDEWESSGISRTTKYLIAGTLIIGAVIGTYFILKSKGINLLNFKN